MLQVRGGALFIVLQGRYQAWRQLQAGKTVVLNFHAKGDHQRLTGGAGLPRSASLGIVPSGTDLPLDGLDSLLESVMSCLSFST